jgi:hypothetical protein
MLPGIKQRPSSLSIAIRLDADNQLVFHRQHAGSSPRGPLCLVPLGPGAHPSTKDDRAVLRVHLNASLNSWFRNRFFGILGRAMRD